MANLSYVGAGLVNTVDGAIVGATPSPYCAAYSPVQPVPPYMTTGALTAGDPADLGGLADATVEFWFQVDTNPPLNLRTLVIGPESGAGLRQWGFELNTTGTVRFYVRDAANTLFLVTSTTAIRTGTTGAFHHLVGVADSANSVVRIYIDGTQEATTAWASKTIHAIATSGNLDMAVGSVANIDITDYYDELAIYSKALPASRITAHYQAGTSRGFKSTLPGARMISALDQSASVHAPRALQAGVRNVTESYMTGQPPLHELQKATEADNVDAMLFVSKSGVITFLGADHRSSAPYNTVQATFGDAGGSELPYLDIELDYSDAFLVNQWNVTREQGRKLTSDQGETQTVSDATSSSRYFDRPQSLDVPVIADSAALDIATALLAKTKDPMLRVTSIALSTADPNVTEAALALELGDRIRVLRTPPGGGARIDQTLFVQKIEVAGANDGQPWSIRLGVSPL